MTITPNLDTEANMSDRNPTVEGWLEQFGITDWEFRLVISDGEWHDVEAVRRAIVQMVPAPVGYRAAVRNKQGNSSDPSYQGARKIAHDWVNNHVRNGTLERRDGLVRMTMRDTM